MAFGTVKGTLSGGNASIPNPLPATGSVVVAIGDLIVAVIAQQTALTVTACTDNLGNTYTAQNAGTDAGNATGRMFYSRITVAGTLTTINAAATASANDASIVAAVYTGPFAAPPIDANVANVSNDLITPYAGTATGTLSQASELVICWMACDTTNVYTGSSPLNKDIQNAFSANINAVLGSIVVTATTTSTPSWTGTAPTVNVIGVASFKEAQFARGWDGQLAKAPLPVVVPLIGLTGTLPLQDGTITQPLLGAFQCGAFQDNAFQMVCSHFGWLAPLAKAVDPVPAIIAAGMFLAPAPMAVTPVTTPSFGWYQQLAKAPSVPVQPEAQLFIVPAPPTQVPQGWYGKLTKAPNPIQALPAWSYVPLNTPQLSVNFTNFGWFAGLTKAPAPLGPAPSYIYVPYNTTQIATYVPTLEWQQPFLVAKPQPSNFADQPSFVAPIFTIPSGWASQLYKAPDPLATTVSWSYVPYNTPQLSVNFTNFGWYQQLAHAPIPVTNQPSWSYVPYNTAQIIVYTNFGWYQQLTRAPAVVRSSTSWSYVPSPIRAIPQGWYTQLAHSPIALKPAPSYTYVPLNTTQTTPVVHPFGWYQQLTKAPVPVVPHPTQPSPYLAAGQRSNSIISLAWHQELSHASPRPPVQITWSFTPLNTTFVPPPFVETPAEPKYVRDFWDRDEWGNFIPGAGIRQV